MFSAQGISDSIATPSFMLKDIRKSFEKHEPSSMHSIDSLLGVNELKCPMIRVKDVFLLNEVVFSVTTSSHNCIQLLFLSTPLLAGFR